MIPQTDRHVKLVTLLSLGWRLKGIKNILPKAATSPCALSLTQYTRILSL